MNLVKGQLVSLSIHDIAFGGEGVGRVEDFVVFVPFVLVGEKVEAEIVEVKKSFARAKLVRVVEAAAARVTPACAHFAACGGCQYQHIAYETQLAIKHKQVADLFERIGGLRRELVSPVVPCPRPYGYRNRIMIRSQWNKPEQRLNLGFVRWDCGLVEDVFECQIAEPALNEQLRRVRQHPPPKGGLKVVLRLAPEDWVVPRDSFFQNNFFLLPKLVETVKGMLTGTAGPPLPLPRHSSDGSDEKSTGRHLLDLYCGVGFFAIELAAAVESFVGVEYDQQAIAAARQNAVRRGAGNGEFIAGRVEDVLPDLVRRFSPAASTVLMDPPRKGCQPGILQLLRELRPAQVIYVSCHPATMARDLNLLCAEGVFELVRLTPLDMFPQTQHVECVADLRAVRSERGN